MPVFRLVVVLGVALLAAALAAYLLLHTQPAEQLSVNNTYAAIVPTDGKVEVVVYRNGHLEPLGTFNDIEFHNQNVPYLGKISYTMISKSLINMLMVNGMHWRVKARSLRAGGATTLMLELF